MNYDNVLYAGDAVNGGGTVVQAVAEGKQVAERISLACSRRSLADLDKLSLEGESEALAIDFCGIKFPNPFCLSSSPVTNTKEILEPCCSLSVDYTSPVHSIGWFFSTVL